MPIPQMMPDETQREFMNRCLADPVMVDEFEDDEQRAAVCRAQIPPSQSNFTRSLVAEVFAPGKWNGMSFSTDDLKKMVESFKQLRDVHKVPLKLGHNDIQPKTDGEPALGWVEDLFLEKGKDGKTKLMARFGDIPNVVFNALKKKLYRKVSIELDMGVTHPRGKFDYVLSGVALLGADLPAVNVLADLTAYMSRGSMTSDRRLCFTAISHDKEGTDVSEELKAQLAEIRGELDKMRDENATLKAENQNFSRQEEERKQAEAKAKVDGARSKFTKMLEDAVKGDKILPSHRETFSKILRLDDDKAVIEVDETSVQALIDSVGGVSQKFSKESAHGKGATGRDKESGVELTEVARDIQNKTPGLTFSRALERAMAANSELAEQHMKESAVPKEA